MPAGGGEGSGGAACAGGPTAPVAEAPSAGVVGVTLVPVKTAVNRAFDIRYGHWTEWCASENRHPSPFGLQYRDDNGLLLVFPGKEARDAAAEKVLKCL